MDENNNRYVWVLKCYSITGTVNPVTSRFTNTKPFPISVNSKLKLSDLKTVILSSACVPTRTHTYIHAVLLFRLKPLPNRKHAYVRTQYWKMASVKLLNHLSKCDAIFRLQGKMNCSEKSMTPQLHPSTILLMVKPFLRHQLSSLFLLLGRWEARTEYFYWDSFWKVKC